VNLLLARSHRVGDVIVSPSFAPECLPGPCPFRPKNESLRAATDFNESSRLPLHLLSLRPVVGFITNMSIADWDNEYARLARAATQLRTPGLDTQASDVPSLQQALQRLEHQLDGLGLQPAEVMRRKRLVQHLMQTTSTQQSSGSFGINVSNTNRPTEQPQQYSQMSMAMRQQDDLIDELAVGIGRLKHQTISIGEEASMHVNLLNQMEEGLDAAEAGLQAETRRAARLKEDQSVWRLQLILAGEFILLILLIFMGLT
jgi:hypothetical protein